MEKLKLTDSRIFLISEEFASLLNDYCFEDDSYKKWELLEYRAFVDKHYDDLVLGAIEEGMIMPSEKRYFKTNVGDLHEAIKMKTIEILKVFVSRRVDNI